MPPLPIPVALPSPADLETAGAEVRATFAADYAAAKTAQDKSKLAEQLLGLAAADQPPAARAAALQAALRLAVEAQDVPAGVDAGEKMNRFFTLDTAAASAVLEAYEALLKAAKPADSALLGRGILTVARKAMFHQQDTVAEQAASLLMAAAKKSHAPDLVKAGEAMAQRVADKAAVAAADRKAGETPDAAAGLSVADAWHDWAVGQKGPRRAGAEGRALDQYLALGTDVDESGRDRVAKRIAELEERTRSKGAATGLMSLGLTDKSGGATVLFTRGIFNVSPFTVGGKEWPHAFCYAPKSNSTSILRFDIHGTPSRLQGHAAVFSPKQIPPELQPISPLVFTVVGDGKVLWRSRPLGKREQVARYDIDIEGVSILELHHTSTGEAFSAGGGNFSYGAWLDPELVE